MPEDSQTVDAETAERLRQAADSGKIHSIADRAKNGDGQEPEPGETGELFPLGTLEGDGKSLRNLFPQGLPVEVTTSIRSAEVPSPRGGLFDPAKEGRAAITYEVEQYVPIPVRENGKIVKIKIRQILRPTYVEQIGVETPDAAQG